MTTLAAVIIGLVMVGVVTVVIVASWFPVRCARCPGRPRMRPVESAALDARLSPIEQTERRIGATQFVLRACPACRATDLERRPVPGLFAPCRRCSALAARQRHVTVRAATYSAAGLVETRAACEHCHAIDVTSAVTARLRRPRRGNVRGGMRYASRFMHGHGYAHTDDHVGSHAVAGHVPDAGFGSSSGSHVHGSSDAHVASWQGFRPEPSHSHHGDAYSGGLAHEDAHANHDAGTYESSACHAESSYDSDASSYDSDASSCDSSSYDSDASSSSWSD